MRVRTKNSKKTLRKKQDQSKNKLPEKGSNELEKAPSVKIRQDDRRRLEKWQIGRKRFP